MQPDIVVDGGLYIPEGPVWMAADQTLACTSIADGWVYRVWPGSGRLEPLAETGGGPNGATPCADGGLLITQNGGYVGRMAARMGLLKDPPPFTTTAPGLQRIDPNGQVVHLLDLGFQAPNDLAVGPDGTVYFTDPSPNRYEDFGRMVGASGAVEYPPAQQWLGRVWAYRRDGSLDFVGPFYFPNGIGFDVDDSLVVVERKGLVRVLADGSRDWVVEDLGPGPGDGFCVDVDGRFYVASAVASGIHVVEDGREIDFLSVPDDGVATNCCFGGADMRTLFVTERTNGRVLAWQNMPTAGRELYTWPGLDLVDSPAAAS